MLDTDTVSYAIRGDGGVGDRLREHQQAQVCISSITLCELRYGMRKIRSARLNRLIDSFLLDVSVAPLDAAAANRFGEVAHFLAQRGTPIGEFDTLLVAHALSLKATLVTNNTKHFTRVPGLKVENWF